MRRKTRVQMIAVVVVGVFVSASLAKESGGWEELMAGMEKMHAAMMSLKDSGNTDFNFVQLMLPHHQAAIDMAKAELLDGSDPQMRRLAQEIITDQQSEMELMQLWRKQHPAPAPHR